MLKNGVGFYICIRQTPPERIGFFLTFLVAEGEEPGAEEDAGQRVEGVLGEEGEEYDG